MPYEPHGSLKNVTIISCAMAKTKVIHKNSADCHVSPVSALSQNRAKCKNSNFSVTDNIRKRHINALLLLIPSIQQWFPDQMLGAGPQSAVGRAPDS